MGCEIIIVAAAVTLMSYSFIIAFEEVASADFIQKLSALRLLKVRNGD